MYGASFEAADTKISKYKHLHKSGANKCVCLSRPGALEVEQQIIYDSAIFDVGAKKAD